jgi:hypothetical protein
MPAALASGVHRREGFAAQYNAKPVSGHGIYCEDCDAVIELSSAETVVRL